jgi:hypothetical protein
MTNLEAANPLHDPASSNHRYRIHYTGSAMEVPDRWATVASTTTESRYPTVFDPTAQGPKQICGLKRGEHLNSPIGPD